MYQQARESFWLPREINLSIDAVEWATLLSESEKHVLSRILAFFATADGIVADNIVERFSKEVNILEAKYFYEFQTMMWASPIALMRDAYLFLVKTSTQRPMLSSSTTSFRTRRTEISYYRRRLDYQALQIKTNGRESGLDKSRLPLPSIW